MTTPEKIPTFSMPATSRLRRLKRLDRAVLFCSYLVPIIQARGEPTTIKNVRRLAIGPLTCLLSSIDGEARRLPWILDVHRDRGVMSLGFGAGNLRELISYSAGAWERELAALLGIPVIVIDQHVPPGTVRH